MLNERTLWVIACISFSFFGLIIGASLAGRHESLKPKTIHVIIEKKGEGIIDLRKNDNPLLP